MGVTPGAFRGFVLQKCRGLVSHVGVDYVSLCHLHSVEEHRASSKLYWARFSWPLTETSSSFPVLQVYRAWNLEDSIRGKPSDVVCRFP